METDQKFLNVGDAAAYLGVSAASLRKWSDDGLVEVYRTPGGQRRFHPEDLDAFLASMRGPELPRAVPRYGRTPDYSAGATAATAEQRPAAETARRERRAATRQSRRAA